MFPGILETLLDVPYDVESAMGVPYAAFEALTLGTIASIVAIALVGYVAGRRVRREQV